jgi:hypothetical protein
VARRGRVEDTETEESRTGFNQEKDGKFGRVEEVSFVLYFRLWLCQIVI